MFQLNSKRLKLLALNYNHLVVLSTSRTELEQLLGLEVSDFQLTDENFLTELDQAISTFILPNVAQHPESYIWHTHWLIIDVAANMTVGGIGTAGLPNKDGESMIGYYIDNRYENKGYATEATICFCNWLFENSDVKAVIADTQVHGLASQKVLQKAGFVFLKEVEEGLRWILKR